MSVVWTKPVFERASDLWQQGCSGTDIARVLEDELGVRTSKNGVISTMHRRGVRQFATAPRAEVAVRRAATRLRLQSVSTVAMTKASVEKRAAATAARAKAPKRELPPVPKATLPRIGETVPSVPRAPRPPSPSQFRCEPGPPGGIPLVETREGQCR